VAEVSPNVPHWASRIGHNTLHLAVAAFDLMAAVPKMAFFPLSIAKKSKVQGGCFPFGIAKLVRL
jgi:hypothetical protein